MAVPLERIQERVAVPPPKPPHPPSSRPAVRWGNGRYAFRWCLFIAVVMLQVFCFAKASEKEQMLNRVNHRIIQLRDAINGKEAILGRAATDEHTAAVVQSRSLQRVTAGDIDHVHVKAPLNVARSSTTVSLASISPGPITSN